MGSRLRIITATTPGEVRNFANDEQLKALKRAIGIK